MSRKRMAWLRSRLAAAVERVHETDAMQRCNDAAMQRGWGVGRIALAHRLNALRPSCFIRSSAVAWLLASSTESEASQRDEPRGCVRGVVASSPSPPPPPLCLHAVGAHDGEVHRRGEQSNCGGEAEAGSSRQRREAAATPRGMRHAADARVSSPATTLCAITPTNKGGERWRRHACSVAELESVTCEAAILRHRSEK